MNPSWSVAVFTSREDAPTLRRTIEAVIAASASHETAIDVLVDHNAVVAEGVAAGAFASLEVGSTIRLWSLPWRDKACAWNRYLHEIAPVADLAFFVDGYVRPRPDCLGLLARALEARPEAWAASGVPTVGRSARQVRAALLAEGGLHGNCYALRAAVVGSWRTRGFRLPLGLYRNDSLIGAVAAFAGDPASEAWEPRRRIAVVADATWDNDVAPFGIARLRSAWKRRLRQAQGDLENAAIHAHLAVGKRSPETLPTTVQALLADRPVAAIGRRGALDRWLMRRAAATVAAGRDWSSCREPARLLQTWHGTRVPIPI